MLLDPLSTPFALATIVTIAAGTVVLTLMRIAMSKSESITHPSMQVVTLAGGVPVVGRVVSVVAHARRGSLLAVELDTGRLIFRMDWECGPVPAAGEKAAFTLPAGVGFRN